MASPELREFLQILQGGDGQAIEALLREWDPFLRKAIRLRLLDGRLRRLLDTTDVFHSLLKDFLARKADGRSPVEPSAGLRAYLAAAVHRKIQMRARKERRNAGTLPGEWDVADPGATPSSRVEAEDFHQAVRQRLAEETRLLFDLKARGLGWGEIAAQVGGSPDALRMRLTRAVAAALSDLGCRGASHAKSV